MKAIRLCENLEIIEKCDALNFVCKLFFLSGKYIVFIPCNEISIVPCREQVFVKIILCIEYRMDYLNWKFTFFSSGKI